MIDADPVTTMHANNLRTWLETEAIKHGTTSQIERYHAGVLPEEELHDLARTVLFAGFAGVKRWHGKMRRELGGKIRHTKDCPSRPFTASYYPITFDTGSVGELSDAQWQVSKEITAQGQKIATHPWLTRSDGSVGLIGVTHSATCRQCHAEARASVVKVQIRWNGHDLVREYAL